MIDITLHGQRHYKAKCTLVGALQFFTMCHPKFPDTHPPGIKVEYHANENPLENSEKRRYVSQRLMYPIIKKKTLPC